MAMACLRLLFFFSFILIYPAVSIADPIFLYYNCSDIGNYTSNSIYQANLNSLLSSLSSNTQVDYGFYNFSFGEDPNKVNAIALCRGDVALDDCRSCVNFSTKKILLMCPYYMEAILIHDECMLRYSNKEIFSVVENQPSFPLSNLENVSDVSQFNEHLEDLLHRLRITAASGNSFRKFATDDEPANFEEIYALVQCTPDLSQQECTDCLVAAFGEIPICCFGKQGGRIVRPSCNFRFETYPFYKPVAPVPPPPPTPPPPSPPLPSPSPQKKENLKFIFIDIVLPSVIGAMIVAYLFGIYFSPRLRRNSGRILSIILGVVMTWLGLECS